MVIGATLSERGPGDAAIAAAPHKQSTQVPKSLTLALYSNAEARL